MGSYEEPGEFGEFWEAVKGGIDTVRYKVEKGFGLQFISNRELLQLLEDGIVNKEPRFRTGNP